jgi:hypothetical protein
LESNGLLFLNKPNNTRKCHAMCGRWPFARSLLIVLTYPCPFLQKHPRQTNFHKVSMDWATRLLSLLRALFPSLPPPPLPRSPVIITLLRCRPMHAVSSCFEPLFHTQPQPHDHSHTHTHTLTLVASARMLKQNASLA